MFVTISLISTGEKTDDYMITYIWVWNDALPSDKLVFSGNENPCKHIGSAIWETAVGQLISFPFASDNSL